MQFCENCRVPGECWNSGRCENKYLAETQPLDALKPVLKSPDEVAPAAPTEAPKKTRGKAPK